MTLVWSGPRRRTGSGWLEGEKAPDRGFVCRSVLPVGLQRLHPRPEPDLVGIAILQNQPLDALGMTGGDPEPDWRAEVEHVQAEAVQSFGIREGVDDVRQSFKGGRSGEWRALSEPGVVGRDHVKAAGEALHEPLVLSRRARESVQ